MSGIISIFVYALEAIFVLGVVGSLVVLVLTTIEDTETLFEREKNGDSERPRDNTALGHATHT